MVYSLEWTHDKFRLWLYNIDHRREKMLKNRTVRYQKIDAKILQSTCDVLKEAGGSTRITDLMIYSRADIGRRNFYRHYRNANQIIENNCEYIDIQINEIAQKIYNQPDDLQTFIHQLFICVWRNSINFEIEYHLGWVRFRTKTMPKLRPLLTRRWIIYDDSDLNDEIYDYYCAEFLAIFFRWIGRGAPDNEANHYRRLLENLTLLAVKQYFQIAQPL